jgi:hypothetical protein
MVGVKPFTPKKRKAQFFVAFCHWNIVALLTLNLLTGMRIGWGYFDSPLGGPHGMWSVVLDTLALKGTLFGINVLTLHIMCAWLLNVNVGIYLLYVVCSGASRRLRLTGQDFRTVWRALYTGGFWHNKKALWSANLLMYWLACVWLGVLVSTGITLYHVEWGVFRLFGGYHTVRLLHGLAAYVFLPYVVLHTVLEWYFGTLRAIFKVKLYSPHLKAGCLGLAIALPIITGLFIWNGLSTPLAAARIPKHLQAPLLDGDPNDPVWSSAQAVTVRTVKGLNNPRDYVDVTVKALHDGERIYFRLQWADPDGSSQHLPLLKTPHGWQVLYSAPEQHEENVYYEDALAMYLTTVPQGGCAATCHLGEGPGKGLHYTTGEIGDLWHWKAVRTNPMGDLAGEPGYMDDQYIGPPGPPPTDAKQPYSGGSFPDPQTGGGYRSNFVPREPAQSLTTLYGHPLKLPPGLTTPLHPDPTTAAPGGPWWLHEAQGLPYTAEADMYPVGTLLPNVLIAPFQGDRADVRAKGAWEKGQWTLEVSRVFDTQSPYDVAFTPGQPVYLAIATFNRTQRRHSEHLKPIRVVLQP